MNVVLVVLRDERVDGVGDDDDAGLNEEILATNNLS